MQREVRVTRGRGGEWLWRGQCRQGRRVVGRKGDESTARCGPCSPSWGPGSGVGTGRGARGVPRWPGESWVGLGRGRRAGWSGPWPRRGGG
eukprot:2684898-Prymnesium_polylepis.1